MTRTVCITGGAQGIGRAIALAYAEAGYSISIADVHKEAGLEVIQRIRAIGGKAIFVHTDIADEAQVVKWLALTAVELGSVDVLIHNAGISRNGSLLELPIEEFDRVIAVNLRGAFLCARQAAKYMIREGGGAIVFIASTRALMSEANTEAYSASKGGLLSLAHAMAVSLGPYRIRVNAISPGWIETGDWQFAANATVPRHSDRDKLQHPVGRVGVPADIAKACLYLTGPDAGFITGQNLVIDGGMTVKMIYEE